MTTTSRTRQTPRVEDNALVRGAGRFMDDPTPPNTAYRRLRAVSACARPHRCSEDGRSAQGKEGARRTHRAGHEGGKCRDRLAASPDARRGGAKMIMPFRPSLAGDKVMHVGDPVAMVVAETAAAAQDAARLVQVDYEELTAVITLDDA
jgi:carbon-monoxide dehydrogenase large subunit